MELDQVTGQSDSNHHGLHFGAVTSVWATSDPAPYHYPPPHKLTRLGLRKKVVIYGVQFISVNLHRAAGTQHELGLDDGQVESTDAGCWLATSFKSIGRQGKRISPLSLVSRAKCVGTALPNTSVLEIWTPPLQITYYTLYLTSSSDT
jgi:hypothetical protein